MLFRYSFVLLLGAALLIGCQKEDSSALVIYTYDSFVTEWGAGPPLAKMFKEETGISLKFVSPGDTEALISQILLQKESLNADLVLGVEYNSLPPLVEADILTPWQPEGADRIQPVFLLDKSFYLTPYNYSYLAICYDSHRVKEPPTSLEDLTHPRFRQSLVVVDPRTASSGLGFLAWTERVYGEDFPNYWERLKPSLLTVTDGWASGYGLFQSGEVPMVLSYTTSPVYHQIYEESDRYRAALFDEGNFLQVEGVGLIKGSLKESEGEAFINFLLTPAAQKVVAEKNIMFPVVEVKELLQPFFDHKEVKKTLYYSPDDTMELQAERVALWETVMTRPR